MEYIKKRDKNIWTEHVQYLMSYIVVWLKDHWIFDHDIVIAELTFYWLSWFFALGFSVHSLNATAKCSFDKFPLHLLLNNLGHVGLYGRE